MADVFRTEEAEEQLLSAIRYVIEQTQSRERGINLLRTIEEKCELYAEFPQAGTLREDLGPGVRCFAVDSYVVIYRPMSEGIVVLFVAHGSQDWVTLFRQTYWNE